MPRYESEQAGAVLDTQTSLREWFNTHAEAIAEANRRNEVISNFDERGNFVGTPPNENGWTP